MRMRIALCIILPVCILAVGTGVLLYTRTLSGSLQQPLDTIEALCLAQDYDAVFPHLEALDALWAQNRSLLQCFVDHHAIDDVTAGLQALRAGVTSRSLPDALNASVQLREKADHLLHRDLPLPENIL